ncbi:MAG: SLC13 family permease [Rhodobacteraceae bacterium]|nr:SLC13 family permease [Paracoccaceae bacterium]
MELAFVTAPLAALAVLALVFAGFALEAAPPHATALIGLATLLATGLLPIEDALAPLSNPALVTIACMFVLSGALTRTGALDVASRAMRRRAETSPLSAVALLMLGAMGLSAFVNNTPVVMVLIPVAVGVASAMKASPSRLLIPLSYVTILGGACTLLGTSTNLVIDGVAQSQGMAPFGLFEITPVAIVVALGGTIYLAIAAPLLLKDTSSVTAAQHPAGPRFMIEALIGKRSPIAGMQLTQTRLFANNSIRVIDVLRGDESLRRNLRGLTLQTGDRLVLRSDVDDLKTLRDVELIEFAEDALERVQTRRSTLMEALVGPGSAFIGRQLARMRLRRRYGVYPIAAHRRGVNLATAFETTPLDVGDTVLLEGAPEDLRRLADEMRLVALSDSPDRNLRPEKAPIALGVLLGVVALAALGVASIAALALIAVGVALATRCLDADDAIAAIDGGLLLLIFSMLGIGRALEVSGAVTLIVDAIEPFLMSLGPFALLAAIYLMCNLMTELITNNAVAVVMTPIVIKLGATLGVDPRPLVLVVMISASASFATPIGYQTNTLVYSAGGYRFIDFLRIGAPLNLLVGAIAVTMIYTLYYST